MCHECRAFESNGPACPSRRSGERCVALLLSLAVALRIAAMAGSRRLPMGALQSEHAHVNLILRLASRRVKTAAFTAKTFIFSSEGGQYDHADAIFGWFFVFFLFLLCGLCWGFSF